MAAVTHRAEQLRRFERALYVMLVAMLALNLGDAGRLRAAATAHRSTAAARLLPPRPPSSVTPPPSPPPELFDSGVRDATWFVPSLRTRRIARVSSVRAQDISLFHQAGLEVEVVDSSSSTGIGIGSRTSGRRLRGSGTSGDSSDLLLLPWRLPPGAESLNGQNTTSTATAADETDDGRYDEAGGAVKPAAATLRTDLLTADVLWGQWTSNLQFYDRRLRAGQLVNSLMGLEHDTLGTTLALARSHQRCMRTWGARACNYTSAQLVLHSQRDVSRLESLFGEDELADLAEWREITLDEMRSVWLAKQATYHRSLQHQRASMFEGRLIVASNDPLPSGLWVVQPWPTTPMLWRHHRFILRTWLVVPSVLPLRVYMLQDAWAHVVAKPYRADQLLSSYKDACVHLWSLGRCSVTHAHRVLRTNHEAFLSGLVGVPRSGVPLDDRGESAQKVFWRRRVWPSLEDAATRVVASVWRELAMYERVLRTSAAAGTIAPYRRVALLSLDWIIDEGGRPVLVDVDVDGAVASDELPLSRKYALDALEFLGVGGYERHEYGERAGSAIEAFCARQQRQAQQQQQQRQTQQQQAEAPAARRARPCGASGSAALLDLVDEAHHAGTFARIFPPVGARGCGRFCEFFETGGAAYSHEDHLTWAFLRAHAGLFPPRARPATKEPPKTARARPATKEPPKTA